MNMDKLVKEHIANEVSNAVERHFRVKATASELPIGEHYELLEVEVSRVDKLNTQLRVKTKNAGVHYFTVKLQRNY